MAFRRLDLFSNAGPWNGLAPGNAPSAELALATDPAVTRFGAGASLHLDATTSSLDHRAERAFPAEDLSTLDELRLWIRSSRPGDGAPGRPLFLELALASAGVAFDDPANTWRRRLPVTGPGRWELVRLSLDDLPGPVRSAVSAMRLTVIDESVAFTVHLDALFGARDEMIVDAEAALLERLDGTLPVDGGNAGAQFYHTTGTAPPNAPPAGQRPTLRIRLEGVHPSRTTHRAAGTARDYAGDGLRMDARAEPYALDYALEPFTDQRSHDAALLDGLLRAFAPRAELVAGGVPLPVEWRGVTPEPLAGERAVGRLRILTTLAVRPAVLVHPVRDIEITVDAPSAP